MRAPSIEIFVIETFLKKEKNIDLWFFNGCKINWESLNQSSWYKKILNEKYSTLIADVFQQTFFCASPTDSPYDNTVCVVVDGEEDDEGSDDNTDDAVVDVDYGDDGR